MDSPKSPAAMAAIQYACADRTVIAPPSRGCRMHCGDVPPERGRFGCAVYGGVCRRVCPRHNYFVFGEADEGPISTMTLSVHGYVSKLGSLIMMVEKNQ